MREPRDAGDEVAARLRAVLAGVPVAGESEIVAPVARDRRAAVLAVGPPGVREQVSLSDLARVGEPLRWSDIIPAWPDDTDLTEHASVDPLPLRPSRVELSPVELSPVDPEVLVARVRDAEPGGSAELPVEPAPAAGGATRWPTGGFPVGSAWASVPAGVSASLVRPGAPGGMPPVVPGAGEARDPDGRPSPSAVDSSGEQITLGGRMPVVGLPPSADGLGGSMPSGRPVPDARLQLAPPAWVLPEEPAPVEVDPLAGLGVSESWSAPRPALDPAQTATTRESVYPGTDSAAVAYPEVESVTDDGAGLSGVGAFGGGAGERRMGLRAFDPGRRGVRALAAVALLVILVAAFLAWRARPRVDPVATPSFAGGTAADGAGPAEAEAAATPASASAEVVVAVAGKVRKPGLVRLPAGSRVADALTAAGGAQPGVDVSMLNLARKVVDGELILVGVAPSPGTNVATGAAAAPGGLVNLNTATVADLDTLPGVGPVLAQRIIDARTAQGGFRAVSDLRKVSGIGDARYEQLKDLVTV